MASEWLLQDASKAKEWLDDGDEPNASDWPGRTPGDRRWLSAKELRRSSCLSLPAYKAREIGWPKLLDDLNENLTGWWSAWFDVVATLKALPQAAVDQLGRLTDKPWTAALRRTLIEMADPINETGPRTTTEGPSGAVKIHSLIRYLQRSNPPDWDTVSNHIRGFDADLVSLDGLPGAGTTTAEVLAGDQGREQDITDEPITPAKLADRLGIPQDDEKARKRLNKRLERWRNANPNGGWVEVSDPKPRQPRYLYPLRTVLPIVEDLKPSG